MSADLTSLVPGTYDPYFTAPLSAWYSAVVGFAGADAGSAQDAGSGVDAGPPHRGPLGVSCGCASSRFLAAPSLLLLALVRRRRAHASRARDA
jgi:hypothetical protein